MTPEEKSIIAKELKQMRAFLAAIRTQNLTINQELVGMVQKVARLREAQLGISALIDEFEKRLK